MAIAVAPEAAAAFADVVINAVRVATALAVNQAFQGAAPSVLPSLDWAHIAGILNTAYPGFTQPKSYTANTVGALMAEMIAHISGETQGLYFGTLAIAQDIDTLQAELNSVQSQLRTVAGGAASEAALINLSQSVAALGRTVNVDYAAAVSHANQLYNQALTVASSWVRSEAAARANADTVLLHYDQGLYNQAVAHANAITAAEAAARANADTVLLHYDQQLYNQAIARVGQEQSRATGAENQLHGQIVNGVSTAESYALSTATALTTSMAAKIMAQVQPQIAKINTELDDCLAPMCDTVSPNSKSLGKLGNMLTQIEQATFWAILVALLAECVHNPAQAARDIDGALSGVVNATLGGLRDLIGI